MAPMPRSCRWPLAAPSYWPSWCALAALSLLARLPYRCVLRIGSTLGDLLYLSASRRRRIAQTNLALCFPDLDARQRQLLLRRNFRSIGIGLLEAPLGWHADPDRLRGLARVDGLEHLHAARASGRGVIVVGMHMTTLEIAGSIISQYVDAHVVSREQNNPVFERSIRRGRARRMQGVIDRSDTRSISRCLRNGHVIWYAPDQDYGNRHAVFTDFFGVPAATLTTTARLARLHGSAVLLFSHYRTRDGSGYRLVFSPPIADVPSGDDVGDTHRIGALIEAAVRRQPDQYLWIHRRFKTRPPGQPSPYGDN